MSERKSSKLYILLGIAMILVFFVAPLYQFVSSFFEDKETVSSSEAGTYQLTFNVYHQWPFPVTREKHIVKSHELTKNSRRELMLSYTDTLGLKHEVSCINAVARTISPDAQVISEPTAELKVAKDRFGIRSLKRIDAESKIDIVDSYGLPGVVYCPEGVEKLPVR